MKHLLIALAFLFSNTAHTAVTLPYSFTSGQTIRSAEINANDQALRDGINNHEADDNAHHTSLEDVLLESNSCGETNIDFNLTQAVELRLENLGSAPTCDSDATGRAYFDTGSGNFAVCDGSNWISVAGANYPDLAAIEANSTGQTLGLALGGTNADLSATGGAGQYLKQSSAGANITVGTIAQADLPVMTGATAVDDGVKGAVPAPSAGEESLFLKGDGTWDNPAGAGDVNGPASSVDGELVLFDGVSGKIVKRGTGNGIPHLSSGVVSVSNIVNADVDASAAIAYSKLDLSGSIVNADVNAAAAIAYSKLNLGGSIVNTDVSDLASIAYSKLDLSGSIVNADVSSSAAIDYSKIGQPSVTSKTANYTADSTDYVILCDASGGNFTISLPTAVGIAGKRYWIKSTSTGVLTVDPNGTETIDGATTRKLAKANDYMGVVSDGTNWKIFATNVKIYVRYTLNASSASTSFVSGRGTGNRIDYNVVDSDVHGVVTTGSSWVLTAPYAGRFAYSAGLILGGTGNFATNEYAAMVARKGSTEVKRRVFWLNGATIEPHVFVEGVVELAAGETLSFNLVHISGNTQPVNTANTTFTNVEIWQVD